MKRLPAWIGWPGTGSAPGHDWLPGPKLRFTILFLTYAFLALALTVDYAYSVTFFLLAIIGTYVGLRRGFVNGLTRAEKWVMIAFAAYPAVAICSYLVGTQTNVGFRFLGRDLRFLLFIPIYLAVRWSRPKAAHLGWALAGAAVGACILAALQAKPWPAPMPHGVTGTHITFGDLGLLSGTLAAWLLRPGSAEKRRSVGNWLLIQFRVWTPLGCGIATVFLAGARGGWLFVPLGLLLAAAAAATPANKGYLAVSFVVICFSVALLVGISHPLRHRAAGALRQWQEYWLVDNPAAVNAFCVDQRRPLSALLMASRVQGSGTVAVVRLPPRMRGQMSHFGCHGGYALSLRAPRAGALPFEVRLYRGNWSANRSQEQRVSVLALGGGMLNVGWKAPWTRITSPVAWRRYDVAHRYGWTAPLNLRVAQREELLVIPLQVRVGEFMVPLLKTSIGLRLRMWEIGWNMFLRHALIGVGTGAFGPNSIAYRTLLPARGDLIVRYEHAHSDYVTTLSTKGILGFFSLILLLAAPLLAGFGALSRETRPSFLTLLPLVTVGTAFATFGLTETMFIHSLVVSWYVVICALTVSCVMSVPRSNGA